MCAGAVAALALIAPGAALAATGGVTAPSGGVTAPAGGGGTRTTDPTGGVRPGGAAVPARPTKPRRATLTAFSLSSTRLRAGGAPLKVSFRIDSRAKRVAASLRVSANGAVVKTIPLGNVRTGLTRTYSLAPDASLPEGTLRLRITARGLKRGVHASAYREVVYSAQSPSPPPSAGHAFPLRGTFTYGDGFGADRPGHVHQGQDLLAAQGTPIVTPRGGTVTQVAYQAGGAGWYVVVDGGDEDFDYAFMHMAEGSVIVEKGQSVRTGEQLGQVGQTGAASGPHLHFEIWQGAWQAGGHAVDPLPYLKSWH
jgi:murein DD-endopeptidase MepM/ murein hydrolase activator NlpD